MSSTRKFSHFLKIERKFPESKVKFCSHQQQHRTRKEIVFQNEAEREWDHSKRLLSFFFWGGGGRGGIFWGWGYSYVYTG